MKSKAIKEKYTEVKNLEKRIALLKKLKKTVQEMNKLNSALDLCDILMSKPQFEDDFFHETIKKIEYLEESIRLLTE